MQDSIIREITVKAPKERVYTAISDPQHIIKWFPDAVEGVFEVGQQVVFDFGGGEKAQVYIAAAQPFDYFAYRWYTGPGRVEDILAAPNTLVEFLIEESKEGTKVTMKESGFASLPVEFAEKSFGDNSGGWEIMMDRLEELLNQG